MPVLWMVITSFRSESSAYGTALLFRPTLSEYKAVLTGGLVPFLVDSVVAGVGSSVVVLLLAVPVAYVLVFNRVSHARDILTWLLSFCTAPAMAMVIPAYILARDLHLLDHVQVLDIMYALMNFPIAVWILWSFCRDLPRQLVDAARVDGASELTVAVKVVLPLLRGGIIATGFICLLFAWNEFLLAFMLTGTTGGTLPVFIIGMQSTEGEFWASLSAAGTVATAPMIILGWAAQKHLVRGLAMGIVQ